MACIVPAATVPSAVGRHQARIAAPPTGVVRPPPAAVIAGPLREAGPPVPAAVIAGPPKEVVRPPQKVAEALTEAVRLLPAAAAVAEHLPAVASTTPPVRVPAATVPKGSGRAAVPAVSETAPRGSGRARVPAPKTPAVRVLPAKVIPRDVPAATVPRGSVQAITAVPKDKMERLSKSPFQRKEKTGFRLMGENRFFFDR